MSEAQRTRGSVTMSAGAMSQRSNMQRGAMGATRMPSALPARSVVPTRRVRAVQVHAAKKADKRSVKKVSFSLGEASAAPPVPPAKRTHIYSSPVLSGY